jgi:nicotinamidase-related amidase
MPRPSRALFASASCPWSSSTSPAALPAAPTPAHSNSPSLAFLGTDLDAYLRSRNVTQIVLAGVSTSSGVEATARSAYDLGYHVVFATDAMTDMSRDMHDHSVDKAFPKLGERDLTAAILAQLTSR